MLNDLFESVTQPERILIRASDKTYNEVTNPAAVYDIDSGLLKIGEVEDMQDYFTKVTKKFQEAGANWLAEKIRFIELPKNQELIDNIFGIYDYICRLHKEYNLL